MDLKDFIKETLIQIAKGINEANESLSAINSQANPKDLTISERKHIYGLIKSEKNKDRPVHLVEFDVAVHATKDSETKGGIGIVVATIALGTQGKSAASQASESRIKFSVPMMFPEPPE